MNPVVTFSANNLEDFPLYEEVLGNVNRGEPLEFVEILWDNYIHLDPHLIAKHTQRLGRAIAIHVMWSRFLETDETELTGFLRRLGEHVRVLNPIYVSDHLCRFHLGNTYLSVPLEAHYDDYPHLRERVLRYQDAIERPLLLENYASNEIHGQRQLATLDRLVRDTSCGVLFDISNARAAELNGILPVSAWTDWLAGRKTRCHVGSFSFRQSTQLHHDTHDQPLDPAVLEELRRLCRTGGIESVCYERDYSVSAAAVIADLHSLHGSLRRAQEVCVADTC